MTAKRGNVIDAQLTADRRTLWYLSVAGRAGFDCGEVVRADVRSGASKIVAHAASFAISPDGTRLALGGSCVPGIAVRDLATGDSWSLAVRDDRFDPMRWSSNGSTIATRTCSMACGPLFRIDVPNTLGGSLRADQVVATGIAGAYAPNGLYVLHRDEVTVNGATLFATGGKYDVAEVVPTSAGTYVVATPRDPPGPRALYRVETGRLSFVKAFDYGTLTRVP